MSQHDLRTLLADLAEDVTQAHLVGTAVQRAVRVRRRRATFGSAAAVLVLLIAGLAWQNRPAPGPSPVTSRPTAGATPSPNRSTVDDLPVDRLPAVMPTDADAAPYYPPTVAPPADVPLVSAQPISHATMVYLPPDAAADDRIPYLYAYGEAQQNNQPTGEFHWVKIPVDLVPVRDAGGHRSTPLDRNALGAMGTLAVFAQPDAMVVVDLVRGKQQAYPLPGLNQYASWLAASPYALVSGGSGNWLVDSLTGRAVRSAIDVAALAPLVGGGSGNTTLVDTTDAAPLIRFYDDGGLSETGQRTVSEPSAGPYQISYLNPIGMRYGNLIAQAAGGRTPSGPGDFVVAIDDTTGLVGHVLDLGPGHSIGCCSVLDMGSDSVRLYVQEDGLLQWNLATGVVTRLSRPAAGTIALAHFGCNVSLEIAGFGYACET